MKVYTVRQHIGSDRDEENGGPEDRLIMDTFYSIKDAKSHLEKVYKMNVKMVTNIQGIDLSKCTFKFNSTHALIEFTDPNSVTTWKELIIKEESISE